jgi:hypothetical protein
LKIIKAVQPQVEQPFIMTQCLGLFRADRLQELDRSLDALHRLKTHAGVILLNDEPLATSLVSSLDD